jgi:CRISPR-associated endonuclease/helicase Cas3
MVAPSRESINLMALWAKERGCGAERYHPLPYHLLDVGAVAEAMWDAVLTAAERAAVAQRLQLSEEDARRWLAFLAASHDVGKASVAFAFNVASQIPRLRASGFHARVAGGTMPHGLVSARALRRGLLDRFACAPLDAETLAVAIGGHHGVIPSKNDLKHKPLEEGEGIWVDARTALIELLAETFELPLDRPSRVHFADAMWIAGFVSIADWIGSNTRYFPCAALDRAEAPPYDTRYINRARVAAHRALVGLGWLVPSPPGGEATFQEVFHKTPNAMQRAVIGLEHRLDEPGVVVVEAAMGSGKTEAALWLARRWGERLGQRGFYIALPTQATSDQMFDRVTEYLRSTYGSSGEIANIQLLHGHAALSSAFEVLRIPGGDFEPTEISEDGLVRRVMAAEWFTYRKRGLLAPFGVGTVDQALLAVLQTHHEFVRLFGLAHKTVIVDEVHAYDAYVSTLLEQLLTWLGLLRSSVVLLSATLPDSRRRALTRAYLHGLDGAGDATVPEAHYPRLTVADGIHGVDSIPIGSEETPKYVGIEWMPVLPADGSFPLGEALRLALAEGGTAAVICNTVRRAQTVYQRLKEYFPGTADDGLPELDLLHARYPWLQRAERERRSLIRFGKPGVKVGGKDEDEVRRPRRAVLVATQVIEQSLDLDFDLMVTDLAPIDLILQRSGRLHRHERPSRPSPVSRPRLWVGEPAEVEGIPGFDSGSEAVYYPHVLIRTWLVLDGTTGISIPGDVERLVEAVYDEGHAEDVPKPLRDLWSESQAKMKEALEEERQEATKRYVRVPADVGHLWELMVEPRAEDEPQLHPAVQAMTRLAEPSVRAVLLDGPVGVRTLEGEAVDLARTATPSDAAILLKWSVTLSDPRIIHTLLHDSVPPGWRESALLQRCRAVLLDVDARCEIGNHALRLDPELGVVIE